MITVRMAEKTDIADITEIYNEGIADRTATLEADQKTQEDRLAWFESHDPRHPIIVAEENGSIVGYASLNVFNSRCAYDGVVDFSIYIRRSFRGKGGGSVLLTALIKKASELGYHKLVLSALSYNEHGKALYKKFGFREIGIYKEQGILDDKWIDILVMEKILDSTLPKKNCCGC
ncbi:MAG TPA: arsinothricin resistance N-acetyltransferase ArsN1 family A [Negativicutes bacterium]|nr:arsinothricin resistance N-acetyltransferase ArsN1 family A [Negativicutes bacterium]